MDFVDNRDDSKPDNNNSGNETASPEKKYKEEKDKRHKGNNPDKKERVKQKQHVVQSRGTTKVVIPGKNSEFEYIIFSASKPLIRSIQSALLSDTNFRAVLQPSDKEANPDTIDSIYSVGLISISKLKMASATAPALDPVSTPAKANDAVSSCETLRDRIDSRPEIRCIEHETLLSIMKTLYSQIYSLDASHHMSLPYFGLDDIIIFNDQVSLFINDDKLFKINATANSVTHETGDDLTPRSNKDGSGLPTLDITRAIGREDGSFFPPELMGGKILSLPYTVNSRCAYYSFGMMVAYCATLNPKLIMKHTAIQKLSLVKSGILDPIKGTKLYWFIRRCCASNPADRRMLYV
jgi:hypothetical protein